MIKYDLDSKGGNISGSSILFSWIISHFIIEYKHNMKENPPFITTSLSILLENPQSLVNEGAVHKMLWALISGLMLKRVCIY